MSLKISSPSFKDSSSIPSCHGYRTGNRSPALHIEGIPPATRSLALIVDDPDAPAGLWVHWLVWNIPPVKQIEEGQLPVGSVEGTTSWNRTGYDGPSPPSGTHRYFFKIYALNTLLDLPYQTDQASLERAMEGRIIGSGQLMGLYSAQQ